PHWAEALGLKLGYETNQVYKSGGDLSETSLARSLGATSELSQVLSAALGVAGAYGKVRIARFAQGKVRDVSVDDGSVLAEAPLTFEMTQVDIGYDLAPRHSKELQRLNVGLRFFDYSLPRILYELVNEAPDGEPAAYVFSRETPPQSIRTRYWMGVV